MTFVLAVVVDVTVILAVALLLTLALRRHSAALRHLVLACALNYLDACWRWPPSTA